MSLFNIFKKFALLCASLLSPLVLSSCEVHFFSQSYDVEWYVIAIPTAIVVGATLIITGAVLSKNVYVCSKCGHRFHPKWWQTLTIHVGSDRLFKCPKCGHKGMFRKED